MKPASTPHDPWVRSLLARVRDGFPAEAQAMLIEGVRRTIGPGRLSACEGLDEGSACTAEGLPGTCVNGACDPHICGDGLRTPGEMLATVYDDVPKEAHPLAERQILAHLDRLRKVGRIG